MDSLTLNLVTDSDVGKLLPECSLPVMVMRSLVMPGNDLGDDPERDQHLHLTPKGRLGQGLQGHKRGSTGWMR